MAQVARRRKSVRRQVDSPSPRSAGELTARVREVGVDRLAFVCVDPAKHRSRWMLVNFLGDHLIQPTTVEHSAGQLRALVDRVRLMVQQADLRTVWVIVERTGQYHLPVKRAFAEAGFETRIVHPFATKQYRLVGDPDIKTDDTDLVALHRAAIAGFGLVELPLDENYRALRLLARHRRDLVEKNASLRCQIHEHLHLVMPGYARCFDDLWDSPIALPIARRTGTPQAVLDIGPVHLAQSLRDDKVRYRDSTLDRILVWAREAPTPACDASLHQRIWTTLDDDRRARSLEIKALERDLAAILVRTPHLLLIAIPGINVPSAAELAGEMGPIAHYANPNAITGRAGVYPSRYQSDQTDLPNGRLVRCANRRLRTALLRIADNLVVNNRWFKASADLKRKAGADERAIRVRAAKKFTRLAFVVLAARQVLRHPCCQPGDAVLAKLSEFHRVHSTSAAQLMTDLQAAVEQLPQEAYTHEADALSALSTKLANNVRRRQGPSPLGELLPALLSRLTKTTSRKSSEEQASL